MPALPDSDSELLEARYANHFLVGHNEFEFIFDFGQFHGRNGEAAHEGLPVTLVRIVMAPPFALAFLSTLQRAVTEHERQHGPIVQG